MSNDANRIDDLVIVLDVRDLRKAVWQTVALMFAAERHKGQDHTEAQLHEMAERLFRADAAFHARCMLFTEKLVREIVEVRK